MVFAYSDVSHETVMHKASLVLAAGAGFKLDGPQATMLRSKVKVVSVCAVRTGSGKSQTTRRVARLLRAWGKRVVAIRHPMPYGDLAKQRVQRFAALPDLDRHECTIEEREEYEPHIAAGCVVFAGVDYAAILAEAEKEADVILWDGGNNDLPFYVPDLEIVVADPHRPGHERTYHPGRGQPAPGPRRRHQQDRHRLPRRRRHRARLDPELNPRALVIDAASPLDVPGAEAIRGKRVLAVEDGPTLTHGGMKYGAGVLAARKFGAAEVLDPRPWAVGSIARTFETYPGIGPLLPAMGYGEAQVKDLEATIARTPADLVLVATPIDLRRVLRLDKPALRVGYELQEIGKPDLEDALRPLFGPA